MILSLNVFSLLIINFYITSLLGQLDLGMFFLKSQYWGKIEMPVLLYFLAPFWFTRIISGHSPLDNVLYL